MARTYKRDSRGRFASGGGSGSSRPKARMQQRGTNRLTRDNAGRITSIGGNGATARGGRLKTASGKQRGAVLMKAKTAQGRLRGGKGNAGAVKAKARTNTSAAAFSRRLQRTDPAVAAQRRMQSEMARPMQFSGRKPGGAADRKFRDQASTASYNRQRRSEGVAREARKLLSLASQSPSDWATRPRYSTVKRPSKSSPAWSYSDLSAWGRTSRRRR